MIKTYGSVTIDPKKVVHIQDFTFQGKKGLRAHGLDAMRWAARTLDREIARSEKILAKSGDMRMRA